MEVIVETGNERSLNFSPDMSINRVKLKRLDSLMRSESSYLFESSSAMPPTSHAHINAKEFSAKSDFVVPECASQPLKDFCRALEPYGAKTVKGGEMRREAFGLADTNGTGQLSFAEMDNFILHLLKTKYGEGGQGGERAETLFRLFRPCYLYAFNNVKKLQKSDGKIFKGTKTATADDYISFPEFRVFTVSLRIHAAMFDIFCTIDGGTMKKTHGHDARISLEEFVKSFERKGKNLDTFKYGFKGLDGLLASTSPSPEDVTGLFHKIDTNTGGYILFSEWCTYLKQEEVAAKTHIGLLLSGNLKPIRLPISPLTSPSSSVASSPRPRSARYRKRINTATTLTTATTMSSSVSASMSGIGSIRMSSINNKASKASWKKLSMIMPVTVAGAYRPNETAATEDLRKFIQSFQPYAEKHPTSIALRKADFSICDSNGSGNCSLAEIHNYVSWVLKQDYGSDEGLRIFRTFRPAYIIAYSGAKNIKKNARNGNANQNDNTDEDCIGFAEFRILNAYLCIYAGMLDAFQLIDGSGAGVDENDDRRIQKEEWMKGYAEFNKEDDDVILEGDEDSKSYTSTSSNLNFVAFSKVIDDQAALAAFEDMDADSGGVVRFSEFCDWIAREEFSRNTPLGKLLNGSSLKTEKLHVREWRNSR